MITVFALHQGETATLKVIIIIMNAMIGGGELKTFKVGNRCGVVFSVCPLWHAVRVWALVKAPTERFGSQRVVISAHHPQGETGKVECGTQNL